MRKTDSLFQLIKSLSRADKRNFKLLTQITAGDKKYLRLFDLIDHSNAFEESKLLPIFDGKNAASQLSVAKHYLYAAILKSLVYFRRDEHDDLFTTATQVKILLERNLVQHAAKLLRKAKADAWAKEQYAALLELLKIERRMCLDQDAHKQLASLRKEEAAARAGLTCLGACQAILDAATELCGRFPQARSAAAMAAMEELLQALALVEFPDRGSDRARLVYRRVLRMDAAFRMDVAAMVAASEAIEGYLIAVPHLRTAFDGELAQAQYELAEAYMLAGRFDHARATMAYFMGIPATTPRGTLIWWSRRQLLDMQMRVVQADFEGLEDFLGTLAQGISELEEDLSPGQLIELYFHAGRLCFAASRFRDALRWINLILNGPKADSRADLQIYARLLNMMVHLELGNTDLIEHNLVSTYRFMFGRNWMYPVERDVMRYLKNLVVQDDPGQQKLVWRSIQEEMQAGEGSPLDRLAREALLLSPWVAWHVQGGSIAAHLPGVLGRDIGE
jgi:tetratricopeptide (TPR) repeat protein